MRLVDAEQTALPVEECTVWKGPPSMRSSKIEMPAGVGDGDGDRDAGLFGLIDGGRHHLLGAVHGQAFTRRDVHE